MDKINHFRHSFWKQFITICLLWLIPLLLISSFLVYTTYNTRLQVLREKQDISIAIARYAINHFINDRITDLKYFYNLVDNGMRNNIFDLEDVGFNAVTFMQSNTHYDQIRILDHKGMEELRINYNSGTPIKVSNKNLQNKSNRYYFTESIALNAGELYMSPLDLNKEQGKIEQPLKPVIRLAMPFNDSYDEKSGVIILNYLAEELLSKLRDINKQFNSTVVLLNSQGYFLLNKDQSKEWGFMYKKDIRFQTEQADVWDVISGGESGRTHLNLNYYSFAKVNTAKNSTHFNHWYIVSQLSSEVIKTVFYQQIKTLFPFFVIVCLILLLISWKLAQLIINKQYFIDNLELIVAKRTLELSNAKELLQNVIKGANLGFWDWYYQTGEQEVTEVS